MKAALLGENLPPAEPEAETAWTRLARRRADMEKCFRCSLCKMIPLPTVRDPNFTDGCPAARHFHFHAYSGSGKSIMALSLLDGRISADPALARIVFACAACGLCDVACKFIMDAERQEVNMALREYLVDQGLTPPELRETIDRFRDFANLDPKPPEARPALLPIPGLKSLPRESARVLLFTGCRAPTDPRREERARKLARLLLSTGVDLGGLETETCCGLPLYWLGQREAFTRASAANRELIASLGIERVVTLSGSCLGAFRSKYPAYSGPLPVPVMHASELLIQLLDEGKLRLPRPVAARVTYHDPCYLGRQSEPIADWQGEEKTALGVMTYTEPPRPVNRGTGGVYDPPRRLLRAIPGLEFEEMHRIREYSFCCGAGGGVPLTNPEMADAAGRHRLEEAVAVGAEVLVTACSHCEDHFQRVLSATTPALPLKVMDLVDLVFAASGLED